jgi:RimJ/RimL family protein N-acetyltransferase
MTYPDNLGGRAVAQRAGFTREGSHAQGEPGRHDVVGFSLLPGE